MNFWIGLIVGMFVGAITGTLIIGLVSANNIKDIELDFDSDEKDRNEY